MRAIRRGRWLISRVMRRLISPPHVEVQESTIGRHTRLGDEVRIHARRLELRDHARLGNGAEIIADEVVIGRGAAIEPGARLHCKRLILGDGALIQSGTRIEMTDLVIGDYTTINASCFLGGTRWCRIGHNCWFGHFTVVDSIGTTLIGNNMGVGAHSQLWTHIYFGDVLEGCQFASHRPLVIEDDVWFVGHCIVSPIHAQERSMAMAGSVVTRDMQPGRTYAGVPAKDMTDRLGPQFADRSDEQKRIELEKHLRDFLNRSRPVENRIRIVDEIDLAETESSQFCIATRSYTKRGHSEEVQFMRYLLPTRAKFVPHDATDWVKSYARLPRTLLDSQAP